MTSVPPPLPSPSPAIPTLDYGTLPPSKFAACPKCGQFGAQMVGFTWWGGMLGPKMFTHVKCPSCKTCYNGKTGQSNSTNILIYSLVSAGITLLLIGGYVFLRFVM